MKFLTNNNLYLNDNITQNVLTQNEAENMITYLKTRFVRFLMLPQILSISISKQSFQFVPTQNFLEPWTDEKLYEKYGLTNDEIAFIESMIRPMDVSQNIEADE